MSRLTFGQALNMILDITGQSQGAIAFALGYDVSYISKWIKGTRNPSSKQIKKISNDITKFVLDIGDNKILESIIETFHIDLKHDNLSIAIKEQLPNKLEMIYNNNRDTRSHRFLDYGENDFRNYNSIIKPATGFASKIIERELSLYYKTSERIKIILICDLNTINEEDRNLILKIKEYLLKKWEIENIEISLITNLASNYKDIENIENIIIGLLNLESENYNVNMKIYNSKKIDKTSLIFIEAGRIFHYTLYNLDGSRLFTTTSKDPEFINFMTHTISKLHLDANLLFKKIVNPKLIADSKLLNYTMSRNMKFLINDMNEIFLPYEVLTKYMKPYVVKEKDLLYSINSIVNELQLNKNIKIIFTYDCLYEYIKNRQITILGENVKLSKEDVIAHFINIKKIVETVDNSTQIKIINKPFYKSTNINLYLSNTINFLRVPGNERDSNFSLIEDEDFIELCNDLFDSIWEKKTAKDNSVLISNIEDIIEFTKKMY